MALLSGKKIAWHDPFRLLAGSLAEEQLIPADFLADLGPAEAKHPGDHGRAGVYVDDAVIELPRQILILRPSSLAAGVGCNRNTALAELRDVLLGVLATHRLAPASLNCLASINIKSDEPGLLELATTLELPVLFFDREKLKQVGGIQSPSAMVKKHVGVESVCEAAAILASKSGKLIVPKQANGNVTVAIARMPFTS
jgi:cobalt-precorrin 5A hydrolase